MPTEHDEGEPRFRAVYEGVVTNNADPLRIGRVRVRVPGVLEPESGWARPLGMAGGGEDGVGFYSVPKVGAEVGVCFIQGDPDAVRFLAGPWGAPGGHGQAPSKVRDLSPEEAPQVRVWETETYVIVLDEREGHRGLEIRDKQSGDGISFDGLTRSMEIKSTTALIIKATGAVSIDGLTVTIKNRPVNPAGGPI